MQPEEKTTFELVACRTSVAIPAGMIIWTNLGAVVGVHVPGVGAPQPPRHFDLVHFSAADFPRGIAITARIMPDGSITLA